MSPSTSNIQAEQNDLSQLLKSFTCFPRLAAECRLQIWREVAKEPRNIDVWALPPSPTSGNTLWRFFSTQSPPAMLHVNRESRELGLQYYSLDFGASGGEPTLKSPPRIYVNFDLDKICPFGTFAALPESDFASHPIQHIAFNAENANGPCWIPPWTSNLNYYNHIKTISLYFGQAELYDTLQKQTPIISSAWNYWSLAPPFSNRSKLVIEFCAHGELEWNPDKKLEDCDKNQLFVERSLKHREFGLSNRFKARERCQKLAKGESSELDKGAAQQLLPVPSIEWVRLKLSVASRYDEVEDLVVLENHWKE